MAMAGVHSLARSSSLIASPSAALCASFPISSSRSFQVGKFRGRSLGKQLVSLRVAGVRAMSTAADVSSVTAPSANTSRQGEGSVQALSLCSSRVGGFGCYSGGKHTVASGARCRKIPMRYVVTRLRYSCCPRCCFKGIADYGKSSLYV